MFRHGFTSTRLSVPQPKRQVPRGDRVLFVTFFWPAVSTDETSYEAGIKVQIHSQDEPPFIDQLGFGVAPGFQTFVSCQQQLVSNVRPPRLRSRPIFFFYCSASFCVCSQNPRRPAPITPLCLRTWSKIRLLIGHAKGAMLLQ